MPNAECRMPNEQNFIRHSEFGIRHYDAMPDQQQPQPQPQSRNLSEISHLFLSNIRQNTNRGMPRPVRTPPQQPTFRAADATQQSQQPADMSVDLTPEEFAHVWGDEQPAANAESDQQSDHAEHAPVGPVRALIASHLGAQQLASVQAYASSVCRHGERVGLIAVDASEFRLSVFEHNPNPQASRVQARETEVFEPRKMIEALEELAWDVDRWLLLLPSPRAPESRAILRDVQDWTLLTTCDHDGVVACYRTLKGLSDLHRPTLSLVAVDATSDAEASLAHQRLSGVCQQFLDWSMEDEGPIAPAEDVAEHMVLWCCSTRDKAQLATASQWQVVADFIARAKKQDAREPRMPLAAEREATTARNTAPTMTAKPQAEASVAPMLQTAQPSPAPVADTSEVFELSDSSAAPASIVSAILRGGHELVECPLKPPMCPDASLAVSRDHRLVLVAVARQGLNDLSLIGRGYQWLIENRALIAMALPQMTIDAHQLPRLHLLVDHVDMSAAVLQPILQSASVTVHAYRKLRWAGRTGLLLEAA